MNEQLLQLIKKRFQVEFKDTTLLEDAFTHSSYVNEHRYLELTDNERLEFLGDAVLELIISEYLYGKFTDLPEGKLTKMRAAIVCEDSLAKFAKACQFDHYIRLGKGEENSNGRQRPALLCDLFESFLGALYLDQGLVAAEKFVAQVIFPKIESGAFSHEMDHKTALQEILQRNGDVAISYQLVGEEGPAHNRQFAVEVSVEGHVIGRGQGKSKKMAEQSAAAAAISDLNNN
ncbi:ribonuclease III [Vagococcus intermedius]|uniref:Ribonuclease 3 n=1 Tax=Vagococcus intermedius TaxID=2991418 RepID=A0AAF0I5S8_9ENTE|nr:ribonuclease III [Vagococcus intermedius]WEG73153.1 ribonuclease III [Vagococcus intermedius]WEG75237.1 ribonuclease III [Vagococcus intermedius]